MPFTCSICGEESTRICVRCTKDACNNHICEKCQRCSDCCECEVALSEPAPTSVRMVRALVDEELVGEELVGEELEAVAPPAEPEPEPHIPGPDPDPAPVPTPDEPGPAVA
jgi:transcription elongation factor Elf1